MIMYRWYDLNVENDFATFLLIFMSRLCRILTFFVHFSWMRGVSFTVRSFTQFSLLLIARFQVRIRYGVTTTYTRSRLQRVEGCNHGLTVFVVTELLNTTVNDVKTQRNLVVLAVRSKRARCEWDSVYVCSWLNSSTTENLETA